MSENAWIEWSGGECPVSFGAQVEVQLRSGDTDCRQARDLMWGRDLPRCDHIIAYRLSGPSA